MRERGFYVGELLFARLEGQFLKLGGEDEAVRQLY